MTVMSWGNSEGVKGRCDAKCHDAADPHCTCMCGGRYHGASHRRGGLERAVREAGEEVLAGARRKAAAAGLELQAATLSELFAQASLF